MRLRSVLSEALRNIGAGVSHALLMFAAVLFASTLLGGYEAANVVGLETEVLQRINAYADVGAIVGGTVDGAACDRLADAGDEAQLDRIGVTLDQIELEGFAHGQEIGGHRQGEGSGGGAEL